MRLNQNRNIVRRAYQQGVTLIELIIVVVIVGILAIIGARAFSNSGVSDTAKAQALFEGCTKLSQNAVLLASAAGVSSIVTGNALPAGTTGATTLLDVLIGGSANIKSTYAGAWTQAGISPLTDVAKGSAGSYSISDLPLTFAGGGTTSHTCQFSAPSAIANALVTKYGSGTAPTTDTATDSTNTVIQYGAASSGNRTVTIIRPL